MMYGSDGRVMFVQGPLDYATLMALRDRFIMACKLRGLCQDQTECLKADEFFTKRAKEKGWIPQTPTDINV